MKFKKFLIFLEIPGDSRAIFDVSPTRGSYLNPYRAILRRDYPEPLIALLAFILGIWLWDHYFGRSDTYAPETEEIALVKIDRDLRLADSMRTDPGWLKWVAGADEPAPARVSAMVALDKLAAGRAMTARGAGVRTILHAVDEDLPVAPTLQEILGSTLVEDFTKASKALSHHEGTWWQAVWVESCELERAPAELWRQAYAEDLRQIRARAIAARSLVWLTGLAGLLFLPQTIRSIRTAGRQPSRGYAGAWSMRLGLVVFLVATLAWIGFTSTLELGIGLLPHLPPAAGILLDSAARILPSVIAMALLFRRPSHMVRVLGLDRGFAPGLVFGWTALLMVIDQVLRHTLGAASTDEPGGGLSAGDAGLWGLVFAVVSACLLAPLTEEILYRGVLFRSFRNRLGLLPGAVLSSGIFTILHFYDGYGLASVAIFGIACAFLYTATGSLAATIALHMLYNSLIKIPEWLVYHAPLG